MAGKKVTALPVAAALSVDDLLYVIEDPAGVPVSAKATVGDVLGLMSVPADFGDLSDVDMTSTPPVSGDVPIFDGTDWVPGTVDAGSIDGVPMAIGGASDDQILRVNTSGEVYTGVPQTDVVTTNNTNFDVSGRDSRFRPLVNMKWTHFQIYVSTAATYSIQIWNDTHTVMLRDSGSQVHGGGDATLNFELRDTSFLTPSPMFITVGETYYIKIIASSSITYRNRGPGTYTSANGKFQISRDGALNANVTWVVGTATFVEAELASTLQWEDMPFIPADFGDLGDVDMATTPPVSGDVPVFDGTNWVPDQPSALSMAFGDLSDVDMLTSPPTIGSIPVYDGSNWVADEPSGAIDAASIDGSPVFGDASDGDILRISDAGIVFIDDPVDDNKYGTMLSSSNYDDIDARFTALNDLLISEFRVMQYSPANYTLKIWDSTKTTVLETMGPVTKSTTGAEAVVFTPSTPFQILAGEYVYIELENSVNTRWYTATNNSVQTSPNNNFTMSVTGASRTDVVWVMVGITAIVGETGRVFMYTPPPIPAFDDLSDVDMTTTPPVVGDIPQFDGSDWVPATLSSLLPDVAASDVVAARVFRSGTITGVTANTWTAIPWQTEMVDTAGLVDIGANPTRFTVPEDGMYQISYSLTIVDLTGGAHFDSGIYVNGSAMEYVWDEKEDSQPTGAWHSASNSTMLELSAGDYVEIFFQHGDTVGTPYIMSGMNLTNASIVKVGSGITVNNIPAFDGAKVYGSANQSVADSVELQLEFDTELYDANGYHEGVTNPERLTVPEDGYYEIGGNVGFATNSTGARRALIRKNGSDVVAGNMVNSPGSGYTVNINLKTEGYFTAGTYFVLGAYQDSGGALDVVAGEGYSDFWIRRIG